MRPLRQQFPFYVMVLFICVWGSFPLFAHFINMMLFRMVIERRRFWSSPITSTGVFFGRFCRTCFVSFRFVWTLSSLIQFHLSVSLKKYIFIRIHRYTQIQRAHFFLCDSLSLELLKTYEHLSFASELPPFSSMVVKGKTTKKRKIILNIGFMKEALGFYWYMAKPMAIFSIVRLYPILFPNIYIFSSTKFPF